MNETESYIANQIRLHVWSGLKTPADVQSMITDILEAQADEAMLRGLVDQEFERKAEAARSWPDVTDCDKLHTAFETLNERGVVALHNAGWDKSEAFHACLDAYRAAGAPEASFGICYYTWQDIERVIEGDGLYLGYSSTRPETEVGDADRAAELICKEIAAAGLGVEWDGDALSRIKVGMLWQRRG